MATSKLLYKLYVLLATIGLLNTNGLSAQVLPMLNSFRGRTFNRTVDVSWPVEFDECTFVTDSVVLRHSFGVLFRNCTFESRTGVLYVAGSGDGIILSDCVVKGCSELKFGFEPSISDRNYITGVKINGEECSVLDDQESIIDIDGLGLYECVSKGESGPLIMLISADKKVLKKNETAVFVVRGLEKGMFVGWQSSDPAIDINVEGDFVCSVTAPEQIDVNTTVLISAYTEYGLEAACTLMLMPDEQSVKSGKKAKTSRKKKK